MLSLQQSIEIKESITSYLKATFTFREGKVARAFEEFIHHPSQGMFKGPHISLKLRFVKADAHEMENMPLHIHPSWTPYDHQIQSWHRLATRDRDPQPTILTTGTGSGKTEAFLYPVLDYCEAQAHRPGIKAIILYPMNALATDQAGRLAKAIHEDPLLRGKIRAGLFIGEGSADPDEFPRTMGKNHIIEHRDTIIDQPPDILLTNFKMLDYALMRNIFHPLWNFNLADRELLRFLVLDELHTYDGAQGTDVANLIRRLKLKLDLPPGQLCPIGTSATIGTGEEAPLLLAEYASRIFGETIDPSAILSEKRMTPEEFFQSEQPLNDFLPGVNDLARLEHRNNEDFEEYRQRHFEVWRMDRDQLTRQLMRLQIVKDLVIAANQGNGNRTPEEILYDLARLNKNFAKLPQWDEKSQMRPRERMLKSLLTLITAAQDEDNTGSPFMFLQVQLWVRELSGIQYTVEAEPKFSFRDQIETQSEVAALPPWYCRECNSSGWLGAKADNRDQYSVDVNKIYGYFFGFHKNLYFMLPGGELSLEDLETSGYSPDDIRNDRIDPGTLHILGRDEGGGIEIQAFRKIEKDKSVRICPCCNTRNTVAIVGTKIPTLSSVSVSQTLATDLDPAPEKSRKVLAFTNSVQDAAHQAGFLEARNYRFTFRSSLQKVINLQEGPVRLTDLEAHFLKYWKQHSDETGGDPISGFLYRFFPKDYIGRASPDDYRIGNGYAAHFLREFDLRMQWEIYSEFGFNSLIGRTLEKTGASGVFFDRERLKKAWESMKKWLEENDVSQSIDQEGWITFSLLVLHRIRQRGGISHTFLDKFREEDFRLWHLNWMKDSRHFLNPRFGSRSRLPKLLTTDRNHRQSLLDTTYTRKNNWFHVYFRKSFLQASSLSDFINEFYETWIQSLLGSGVLDRNKSGTQDTYAIRPEVIFVQKNVNQFKCDTCEQVVYCQDAPEIIGGAPCVSYRCDGHLALQNRPEPNYYQAVYNRNHSPRVYAAEHTGLLSREVREDREKYFRERPHFNSVNVMVATSTLEMGIDIGDLNTAYNNSIPPLPANFLQRIGRAGRSSGAALIVNFAKHQDHDLYYFTDPLKMMQGEIATPGCYLEAKDILERHFTAYCIDSWTSADPLENTIPNQIRQMKLDQQNLNDPQFFITRIITYIKENREVLVDRFLKHYDRKIREEVFPEIRDSLEDERFYDRLYNVFSRLKEELRILQQEQEKAIIKIREHNLGNKDDLYKQLIREQKNLRGIYRSIGKRNTLEHLTNEGILPNYAFPETGVRLNATVMGYQAEGAEQSALDQEFEIVRPASQAIRELAPENFFYTQGYRFEIEAVNIFDWNDRGNHHTKRFCSRCDHLEIDSLSRKGNCPKCGDPSWGSSSNVHPFVRLTQVRSFAPQSRASLSDDHDDRELVLFDVMNHIRLSPTRHGGAWILKDIPFGIEYVSSATITSVNYGRSDMEDARKLIVNRKGVLARGFVTCRHCGKSRSSNPKEDEKYHFSYCKYRGVRYDGKSDEVFNEVYFFREFQTEILKVLLPVQEFNTSADIQMFQSGLELGLQRYFRGNPTHIRLMSYEEYNDKSDRFDRYLVLYDTIPGGTGYLKQLADHLEFNELLRLSYEAIRDCKCQYEGKEGCYQCIFSYGNQYHRQEITRNHAETWFAKIVNKADEWKEVPEGLSGATNDGRIEESELEDRFIRLIQDRAHKTEWMDFRLRKEKEITLYELKIQHQSTEATYSIHPQVKLGPRQGIEYNTRVDFLIRCEQYLKDGKEMKGTIPHIAVYLDGYQYHASGTHPRFRKDLAIRQAISRNPEYMTWSLVWKDLDYFEAQTDGDQGIEDALSLSFNRFYKPHYNKLLNTINRGEKINYSVAGTNMERLLHRLTHPVIPEYENSYYVYLASWTKEMLTPSFPPESLQEVAAGKRTEGNYIRENRINDFNAWIPIEGLPEFDFILWKAWVNVGQKKIYQHIQPGPLSSEELEKSQWEEFWLYYNLLQAGETLVSDQETENKSPDIMAELRPLYPEEYHPYIEQWIEKGWIREESLDTLNSLVDESGRILAEADFIFPEARIAVAPFSAVDEKNLKAHDFKVFTTEQLNEFKE